MSNLRPSAAWRLAALILAVAALASCTDMGAGSDPKETEGAFLLALPTELRSSGIKAKAAEDSPEGEEPVGGEGSDAPPSTEEEPAPESAPQEPTGESPAAPDIPHGDALAEDADNESGDALPAEAWPLEEGIAVSRYSLYMVSALGFRQEEEIEPSDEPARVVAQAGSWKIVAVAEDLDGKALAACELSGVALSAGEEKALSLEWQAP